MMYFARSDWAIFKYHSRMISYYKNISKFGQVRCNVIGNSVSKIILALITSDIFKWKNDDRRIFMICCII